MSEEREGDREDEEAILQDLFGSLRSHVADLSRDFSTKLKTRLDAEDEGRGPEVSTLLGSFATEIFNLLGAVIGAPRATDEEDNDDER